MAVIPRRQPLMSEQDIEQVEMRLRRIFVASLCLTLLLLFVIVFLDRKSVV